MGEVHQLVSSKPYLSTNPQIHISARDLLYNLTSKFYNNDPIDIFIETKYQNSKSQNTNDHQKQQYSTKLTTPTSFTDVITAKSIHPSNLSEYSELVSHLIKPNTHINDKTRIHYTDIRLFSEYYKKLPFVTINLLSKFYKKDMTQEFPNVENIDFYQPLYKDIKNYYQTTDQNQVLEHFFEYYIIVFKKYSQPSLEKYPLYNIIKEYIKSRIKTVLDKSFFEYYLLPETIKEQERKIFQNVAFILNICVLDFYTLNRMFSPWTYKNIIFFGGSAHSINMLNFFRYLQKNPQYNISVFLEKSVIQQNNTNIVSVSEFNNFFSKDNHSLKQTYYNDNFESILMSRSILESNII